MSKTSFEPIKDRIAVKRDVVEEKTLESGIILTEKVQERPQTGEIWAIGPEVKDVKEGDRIMFGKHDGTEVTVDGEKLLIMRENMVWGVLND